MPSPSRASDVATCRVNRWTLNSAPSGVNRTTSEVAVAPLTLGRSRSSDAVSVVTVTLPSLGVFEPFASLFDGCELTCSPTSGFFLPLSPPTTITCTGTDASGNEGLLSFDVAAIDTLGPIVTPPADMFKLTRGLADTPDTAIKLCELSIVNQCRGYMLLPRDRIDFLDDEELTPERVDQLAEHTIQFSLAGIRAVQDFTPSQALAFVFDLKR